MCIQTHPEIKSKETRIEARRRFKLQSQFHRRGRKKKKRERGRMSIETQVEQGIPQIAFDLFVKKTCRNTRFTDAYGNLVYVGKPLHSSLSPPQRNRALSNSSGTPLISIFRDHDGSWKALKGDGCSNEVLFRVVQTLNTSCKVDFNIFLIRDDDEDVALTMRGCVNQRSCTIYKDKSIIAQTNLMHKLGYKKIYVQRNEFRVTFFPGFSDYSLIAALVLIFLDGR